jgi:hypothetical protein
MERKGEITMFSEANRRRFVEKVKTDGSSGCWLWEGKTHPSGYGFFNANGRKIYAHRYPYEYLNGPVPPSLELDHVCENKACIRPDHLDPVTHAENMRRAGLRGAWSGERNSQAKRTELEVEVIKRAHELGAPVKDLARIFNIPLRSVYYIIKRENWRSIEP